MTLATAPGPTPERFECLAAARRTSRWWLMRRPPLDVLVPVIGALAESLPGSVDHPLLRCLVALSADIARREVTGQAAGSRFLALAAHITSAEALRAVAAATELVGDTWWELPLLALLGDAAAAWVVAYWSAGVPARNAPQARAYGADGDVRAPTD
jgi:hypothetical protein